jgi:ribosomal protein S18 acetylase RimI-like enzyme
MKMQIKNSDEEIAKLDNPVWWSLYEVHKDFSIHYGSIKFYHPDYCPFGGFVPTADPSAAISTYSKLVDNFFVVGEKPTFDDSLQLQKELVCLQMVCDQRIDTDNTETITPLHEEHRSALFELVNLVQPGYFKYKTPLLGDYYGIFKKERLVAVTGERMKMNSFTEISAVVTHPDHTGRGYAKQLVAHAANNVFNQERTPYLHVAENNFKAIMLYEQAGFVTRRKISFWNITR